MSGAVIPAENIAVDKKTKALMEAEAWKEEMGETVHVVGTHGFQPACLLRAFSQREYASDIWNIW